MNASPAYRVSIVTAACVSVVIGSPSPVFLLGLTSILSPSQDFNVLAACTDHRTCFQAIRDLSPNVALLDVSLMEDGLPLLAASKLGTRLVVFASSADKVSASAEALPGLFRVVPRDISAESLLYCMRQAVTENRFLPAAPVESPGLNTDGSNNLAPELTQRECQVAQLVSLGLSNKQIGRELSLAPGTVKIHLHRIFQKLAVHNRTALAVRTAGGPENDSSDLADKRSPLVFSRTSRSSGLLSVMAMFALTPGNAEIAEALMASAGNLLAA